MYLHINIFIYLNWYSSDVHTMICIVLYTMYLLYLHVCAIYYKALVQ